MTTPKSVISFNLVLFFLAFFLMGIIFLVDINVPLVLAVSTMYCVVILYSWILPGKLTPIYMASMCSILIIVAAINSPPIEIDNNYFALNAIISIISVWITTSLVAIAKFSVKGLETSLRNTQSEIQARTDELADSQHELQKNQKLYKSLLESAPDATIIVNEDGQIIMANKQVQVIFGFESSELLSKPIEVLIPEAARINHRNHFEHYLQNLQFRSMGDGKHLRGLKKDGSTFPVEISLSPTTTVDETLISASIRDISARVAVETNQLKYTKRLKEKNRELEQFVYIASHDLQEPLRTMSSFVRRLSAEIGESVEGKSAQYLSFISESAERMSSLVSCLLDYGRLGKNSQSGLVDLNVLIMDVLDDLGSAIHEANAQITADHLPTLNGLETELRCLFQNLIGNAIKFRKDAEQPIIKISSEALETGKWEFSISDNGIGIAPQYQDKIFMIFQRLNPSSKYAGAGIGLAHCRKIVELHDGRIWVESEFGSGCTFKFTLNSLEA